MDRAGDELSLGISFAAREDVSIIRPIIRMCARQALLNKTWAETRVYDSDNTPLIDALETVAKPYITVYTDEDNRVDVDARDIYSAQRNLSLTIEIGVASAVQAEAGGTVVQVPSTDEGMELTVDILEEQVRAALFADPTNEWGEILRGMILRVLRVPSQRGGSSERGTRWAARQITFVCDVISDLPPNVPLDPNHVMQRFITKAKTTSPAMLAAANILEAVMKHVTGPDWQQVQAWLSMTREEIRAIGLAPVNIEDEVAATIKTIDVIEESFLDAISVTVGSPEIGSPEISINP